jgi:CelD/BcsL family acetyltransferase involved in cellulose biosynthesis
VATVTQDRVAAAPLVEIERGGAEIVDRLADEWRELCREGNQDEPFYRPEWVSVYLRTRVPDKKSVIVTARIEGRLKAVLPLIEERSLFLSCLPVRKLRGASELYSWRFDLVRAPGPEGDLAVEAVWKSLRNLGGWDLIELPDVPRGGAAEQLLEAARLDGYPTGRSEHMFTPLIQLSPQAGADDSQFMPRSINLQRSLRRILRKAASSGTLQVERFENADAVLLERFYDLERSGWKGQQGTAIASGSTTRGFFDELARVAAKHGYLSLYFLRVDGKDVAGHFGIAHGGRYFMVKCAYDEKCGQLAPGHLLVHEVLRECARRGFSEFDFMAHGDEWKRKWTDEFRPHAYCFVFDRSPYGRLLEAAKFKLNPALKRFVAGARSRQQELANRLGKEGRSRKAATPSEIATKVGEKTVVVKAERGGLDIISRLSDQWSALCEEGASDQPFFRPEWIAAYVRAFEPHGKLLLITARLGGKLKAVLPLIEERALFCGMPVKKLRGAANIHSCRFDIARGHGPGGDAAVQAIWNYLSGSSGWDVIELLHVPPDAAIQGLIEAARREGFPTGSRKSLRSPYIDLSSGDGSEEWWLKRTDAKFRGNLRRRLRKLQAEGPLELKRYDTANAVALQHFYDLEKEGWKGKKGTAIACHEATRGFYNEVAESGERVGYFSLYLLEWKGEILAGHFGLTWKGRYFVPKLTYQEKHSRSAPGQVMIQEVIRDCVARGISEFDFLGGWAEWKGEWTEASRQIAHWYVFRATPAGRAFRAIKFKLIPGLKGLAGKE